MSPPATALAKSTPVTALDLELRGLRQRIIEASSAAREGHVPSALSILDILWVLYDRILRIDPRNPTDEARDRFVLSKGHASLGLYVVLMKKGFFPASEFEHFGKFNGILGGHPNSTKVPGVEASTGSLGHGFPMAVGAALGQRIRGLPARTFSLIGDGEANEGSVWEAALLGAHHKLTNLTCIVDHNHSTDRALLMDDIGAKFRSFGWHIVDVPGHDHAALFTALSTRVPEKPVCVVAHTIKGHGCPPMENEPAWHHRMPTKEELPQLIGALT